MAGRLYVLARASSPEREPYVGIALDGNPRRRLREHNAGSCGCTNQRRCSRGRPWTLAAVVGVFPHPALLRKFEQLLQHAPGGLAQKIQQARSLAAGDFSQLRLRVDLESMPVRISDRRFAVRAGKFL